MLYKYVGMFLKGDKTWRKKPSIESLDRFAKPGEKFDEDWIDNFDEIIIEEGEVVGSIRGTVATRGLGGYDHRLSL